VAALRKRLAIEDPDVPPDGDVYDQGLADAVSRAQTRYALSADGSLDPATLEALNTPVQQRLAQLRANLERWRWAPRALPASRVELNTADPGLVLYEDGKPELAMRAVVGRPSMPTPMLQDAIEAVVLNPPWYVPHSIAAKEIWPKIRNNPGYMRRQGYSVRPGGGLMQRPGPKSSLGRIKFDLPNRFGVYLHDTPSHNLFDEDERDLSHGCMRIEQPETLARRLLADNPDWPSDRIDTALDGRATRRARLMTPMPVFVFHWTAFVDDEGRTRFRPDVYGWDAKLLALLPARTS
jgi:murein L,D-transpeptidase YcbB/YkuD